MITYEFAKSDLERDARKPQGPVVVLLHGKVVGRIQPMDDGKNIIGYAYKPKNAGVYGETFPTLRECQKSLEAL